MEGEVHFIDRQTVRFERFAACPPARVWQAVSEPEALGRWFLGTTMERHEGGRFDFRDAWGGQITSFEPERRITYTADAGGFTDFELFPEAAGTRIVMTDRMGPNVQPPPEGTERARSQPGGPGTHWAGLLAHWHVFMNRLVGYLEGSTRAQDVDDLILYYAHRLTERFAAQDRTSR
ncbi:MAG: SRPBCC domain-containing protein [Pseudomonadales bacterium]|jgi:uncharacterized protein YndB with AHSA1/START domain